MAVWVGVLALLVLLTKGVIIIQRVKSNNNVTLSITKKSKKKNLQTHPKRRRWKRKKLGQKKVRARKLVLK